jgi:hypothetical protein
MFCDICQPQPVWCLDGEAAVDQVVLGRVGLEYRRPGLAYGFSDFRFGSCCDLILAGEPVEDRSAVQLVAG